MSMPQRGCLDSAGLGPIDRGLPRAYCKGPRLKHRYKIKVWALQRLKDTGMLQGPYPELGLGLTLKRLAQIKAYRVILRTRLAYRLQMLCVASSW